MFVLFATAEQWINLIKEYNCWLKLPRQSEQGLEPQLGETMSISGQNSQNNDNKQVIDKYNIIIENRTTRES